MRSAIFPVVLIALCACSEEPKTAPAPMKKAEAPKVLDESHRFPQQDRGEVKVVQKELLGKAYLPGGNVAQYKKGKRQYELFLGRLPAVEDAPLALLAFKKDLAEAKLIPSFGGYFGTDGGQPVFVFTKGVWVAGIKGLPEKDADVVAREFAARLGN
jgi:hypothetical protein